MAAPRAAGILFVHDGRALLLKRATSAQDAPGTWGLPAGGIERGESPEQAARRELQEECGYTYRGPLTPLYTADGFECFGAACKGFTPKLNDEHTAWQWAPFDDLPQPLHPGFKEFPKMPLIQGKSDKARSENIEREIAAGKDPKQAAAIAYSVQRKARGANDSATTAAPHLASLAALRGIAERCR